uniref:Uncharacterized protein n=1 Tax=Panagrolaimus davidi TaxID=227884 RepID=A0A914QXJ3_9BILA
MKTPVISEQPDIPIKSPPINSPCMQTGCCACGSLRFDTPSYDEDCGMPIVTPCDRNNIVKIECINNCWVTYETPADLANTNKNSKEEYVCNDSGKYFLFGTNIEVIGAYCA